MGWDENLETAREIDEQFGLLAEDGEKACLEHYRKGTRVGGTPSARSSASRDVKGGEKVGLALRMLGLHSPRE